jgi:predicted flap endonuclease-1-like 5' DNA nuclease
MSADLNTYLPLILIALAVLALLVWAFIRAGRKARVVDDGSAPKVGRDVLDEGAPPAQRNHALIDAPRGIDIIQGLLSAVANSQPTAAAPLGTDAEAGPEVIPAPAAPDAPIPAPGSGDDLTRIKGLGPKLSELLGQFGVTTYSQIAAWTPEEIERIDSRLGRFSGRIVRDKWVEQARLLAGGDENAFVSQFGRNG